MGISLSPTYSLFLFNIPGSIEPQIHIIINSDIFNTIGIIITAIVKLSFKNYILDFVINGLYLTVKL